MKSLQQGMCSVGLVTLLAGCNSAAPSAPTTAAANAGGRPAAGADAGAETTAGEAMPSPTTTIANKAVRDPEPTETVMTEPDPKPDKLLRKDGWELRVYYTLKGTRSEGIRGVLVRDGVVVPPGAAIDETMKTALGNMKFYGTEPGSPWEPQGWLPDKLDSLRPSSKSK